MSSAAKTNAEKQFTTRSFACDFKPFNHLIPDWQCFVGNLTPLSRRNPDKKNISALRPCNSINVFIKYDMVDLLLIIHFGRDLQS